MRAEKRPGALAGATRAGNEHRAAAGDVPEHGTRARALPPEARHETADAYARTLATSGRWRVIRCRDDLQFIVQRRAGRAKARPWQAVAYILHANALGPVLQRPSLGIPADDLARLMAERAARGGGSCSEVSSEVSSANRKKGGARHD